MFAQSVILQIHWQTQYKGPEGTGRGAYDKYKYPAYINDFDVGVISTAVTWTLVRGDGMTRMNHRGFISISTIITP